MTPINARDSADDFIVEFSPYVCVTHSSSFLDRLHEGLLTMLMEQQILLLSMICVP